jgi:hypothetical protein
VCVEFKIGHTEAKGGKPHAPDVLRAQISHPTLCARVNL